MTYTTQQLQAMSDFEVNQALAVKLGWRLDNGQSSEFTEIPVVRKSCDSLTSTTIDYCNNPSDIMPLQIDKRLSLIAFGPYWVCTNDVDGYKLQIGDEFERNGGLSFMSSNPLRAIACLLLLMED